MVNGMCSAEGVTGDGLQGHMRNAGLRTSMINRLIETGHTDSSIVLRSGHASVDTLTRYHNLILWKDSSNNSVYLTKASEVFLSIRLTLSLIHI